MKVSVIILSWNKKELVLSTIKSVLKSITPNFDLEIVVVDNGSTDGSVEGIREIRGIRIIRNKENIGFARGNNVGIRYALKNGADYIILLNDDTEVDKNLINNLVNEANDKENVGAISPKIYFAKGFEFHKKRYSKRELGKVIWYAGGDMDWDNIYGTNHGVDRVDHGQYDKTRETDFVTGCCVIFPRKVLEKVGLLDKKYFAYLEDVDLSLRIKKAGYRVLYSPKGHLWHKVSQSSSIGSSLNDYFITRNRLLLGMRYAGLRAKVALVRESLKFLVNGRKWQKIGARDFYFGKFGRGSWIDTTKGVSSVSP